MEQFGCPEQSEDVGSNLPFEVILSLKVNGLELSIIRWQIDIGAADQMAESKHPGSDVREDEDGSNKWNNQDPYIPNYNDGGCL
jgi:hypothetical protein